jgi:tRNA A37 threonylcarbamoyladenosine biosynthesis protein TsaE
VTLIIEWADAVQHVLPDERLTITLQAQDELSRRIGIACPDSLSYLIEGIE